MQILGLASYNTVPAVEVQRQISSVAIQFARVYPVPFGNLRSCGIGELSANLVSVGARQKEISQGKTLKRERYFRDWMN